MREDVIKLKEVVDYSPRAVVSREILDNKGGSITVFAFDEGQKLSEHSVPFDAFVNVIEGEGEFMIGGTIHKLTEGE